MQLGLKIRKYYHQTKKVLYHYQAPKAGSINHPITDEANALVLDADRNLVSGSFRRIRDVADEYSDVIEWEQEARIELQESGVLVKLDKYDGDLLITTKEGVGGKEQLPGLPNRQLDGALSAHLYTKYRNARPLDRFYGGFTYVLQFMYPTENTIYMFPEIILLAIIDKFRGAEMPTQFTENFAKGNGLSRPITLPCNKLADAIVLAKDLKHSNKGIIIADSKGNRVLYRNKSNYNLIDKTPLGGLRMEKFAQAVLDGEHERIKYYWPNYVNILDVFSECLGLAKERLDGFWSAYKHLPKTQFLFKADGHPLRKVLALRYRDGIQSFNNLENLISATTLMILTSTYLTKKHDVAYRALVEEIFENEDQEIPY